jgi:hypothetical protein
MGNIRGQLLPSFFRPGQFLNHSVEGCRQIAKLPWVILRNPHRKITPGNRISSGHHRHKGGRQTAKDPNQGKDRQKRQHKENCHPNDGSAPPDGGILKKQACQSKACQRQQKNQQGGPEKPPKQKAFL